MALGNSSGPRTAQRAYQREEMTLRMRRPPEEYVTLLSQNEQDFRAYINAFEEHPMFNKLINDGAIAKLRLRGRIPRARYEEFMDTQLIDFLRDYKILEHDGWERDFLSPHAMNRVPELAKKYDVPAGVLTKHLRYLRASANGTSMHSMASKFADALVQSRPEVDRTATIEQTAVGEPMVDLTEIIETTREWVQRYEVSEQDFLDLVLSGEATPDELSERFGCSLREAEEVLEAADRLYVADSYEAAGQEPSRGTAPTNARVNETPVAFVQVVDEKVVIQFHNDSVYAQRYQIKPNTLKELRNDSKLPAEARELLSKARLINQRLSALSRLITALCNQQLEYLQTGDMRRLKPLAQAELARQMGEHPSTISRLIRGKVIETPWGKFPILFLCQSKTDVVSRLVGAFPKLTDQEVVSRLRDEFDCHIARRTVAYHRGKRLRRNKRHKANDEKKDVKTEAKSE
jgi:hypothetical protein